MKSKSHRLLTTLEKVGYTLSETYRAVSKEEIEEMPLSALHRTDIFDHTYIRDTMSGDKKEFIVKHSYLDSMNIRSLRVKKKVLFFNTYFNNIKIKDALLSNAIFIACKFKNTYFIQTVCESAIFVNCEGLDKVEFIESKLNHAIFYPLEETLMASLEENQCEYRDILFLHKEDVEDTMQKVEVQQSTKETEEREMDRESIEQKEFKNVQIKKEDIANTMFYQCTFHTITFEDYLLVEANTDFIECRFVNTTLPDTYTKVAFDGSVFKNVTFKGSFSHCSFVQCDFMKSKIDPTAMFTMCNFDYSNANVQFEKYQEQFKNCMLVKEVIEPEESNDQQNETEIMESLLLPIYEYVKSQEKEDVSIESDPKEVAIDYITHLSDTDFILFLTEISARRVTVTAETKHQETKEESVANDEEYL